jgi:hypothetical protein
LSWKRGTCELTHRTEKRLSLRRGVVDRGMAFTIVGIVVAVSVLTWKAVGLLPTNLGSALVDCE